MTLCVISFLVYSGTSSYTELIKENAHNDLFHEFQKEGFDNRLHYINTPKQLILDFYDCKNDTFHVKIVIVLLFAVFFCSKFLSKIVKRNAFPCLNPSLSIFLKVWHIRWSKLHARVFMIKRFLTKKKYIAIKFS